MDRGAQPLACSLDGTELTERLAAWRQVLARATTPRVADGGGGGSYPNDAALPGRLGELIALEGECCSFLRFDVEEQPDAVVTELRLPEELGDATRAHILEVFGRP